jgi:hypothetical protein
MFPFLAVLICTMGVMIVLLVLGVQQAQVDASVVVEELEDRQVELQKVHDEQVLERDDYLWRSELLTTSREDKTRQLADTRLALGHLEEHIRKLEDNWKQLQRHRQLLREEVPGAEGKLEIQRQVDRLAEQVEQARLALEQAREKLSQSQQSFSIVPYQGPNGTRRYPIYLECTPQGVLIQPEGVLVPLADISGMSGPGNPLDACLRTVREFLVSQAGRGVYGDPYPLLVVRPDSVVSYAHARQAMKSWEDAFGYELIDSDIKLSYPVANEMLAKKLEQTIRDARQRQQLLAAAMPSQFGSGGPGRSGSGGAAQYATVDGAPASTGTVPGTTREDSQQHQGGTSQQPPTTPGQVSGMPGSAGGIPGRAAGWALPRTKYRRTGITRSVHVICYANRLVIVPRRGDRGQVRTVHVDGSLVNKIDSFVSEVQEHIQGWGIAVAGGYWKPVLKVEVRPGGATRFGELQRLLKNSGIVVQQYR